MLSGMQVLIVDDLLVNLDLLNRMIARIGDLHVRCIAMPEAALAWSAEHPVDLLLVDYHMPAMTGIAFLRAFRAQPGKAEVPVVVITADTRLEVRHEALRAGATDFLTKPVDRVEVRARVENLLKLRRAQHLLTDRAAHLAAEVDKATRELVAREQELIRRLSRAAEYRDTETGAHILRMARYSHAIARRLGLPEDICDNILRAAPMHDIGKVGIPDTVLLKPGRLEPEELELMRQHTRLGGEILAGSSSGLIQMAEQIALDHHERYDGAGYPAGLRGEEIPLVARIAAVADVFDALTSVRPYKPAWPVEQALDYLRQERGRHFDPACVDAFLSAGDEIARIRGEA